MLAGEELKAYKTDRYIVDRFVEAIEVLKDCATLEQRREYLTALTLVAPPRAALRDRDGMARAISERLGVHRIAGAALRHLAMAARTPSTSASLAADCSTPLSLSGGSRCARATAC